MEGLSLLTWKASPSYMEGLAFDAVLIMMRGRSKITCRHES